MRAEEAEEEADAADEAEDDSEDIELAMLLVSVGVAVVSCAWVLSATSTSMLCDRDGGCLPMPRRRRRG